MNPRNEMSFQPETVPELSRYIEYQFAGVREHIDALNGRLDRMDVITRTEFRDAKTVLDQEIRETRMDLENYKSRQAAMWKWIIGSLTVPMISILVAVLALINS